METPADRPVPRTRATDVRLPDSRATCAAARGKANGRETWRSRRRRLQVILKPVPLLVKLRRSELLVGRHRERRHFGRRVAIDADRRRAYDSVCVLGHLDLGTSRLGRGCGWSFTEGGPSMFASPLILSLCLIGADGPPVADAPAPPPPAVHVEAMPATPAVPVEPMPIAPADVPQHEADSNASMIGFQLRSIDIDAIDWRPTCTASRKSFPTKEARPSGPWKPTSCHRSSTVFSKNGTPR